MNRCIKYVSVLIMMMTFAAVASAAGQPIITGSAPPTPVSDTAGAPRTFNITVNQTVNVTWLINGTVDDTDNNVKDANYANASAAVGYWNVSAVASNPNGTVMKTWWWTVDPSGYTTGNRIWKQGMGDPYLWTAQSFTGFYYDIDNGESTETLKITGIERNLDANSVVYETSARYVDFDCSRWDEYMVIGFMAEKYFAGYDKTKTDDEITDKTISLVSGGMLSKVLIDEDEGHTLSTGASLQLKEGYELKIVQLSLSGGQAQLELTKDGKSDSSETIIVEAPDTFVYTKDFDNVDDVPIIAVYVSSVFQGTETAMVVIDGIFQISEDYTSVKSGTNYDEMEITSVSGNKITMKNDDDIDLSEGETVDLMGDIKFLVADSGTLRFALYEEITEPGTYDIRGTVYNTTETPTWDHMNFEGFYYNINDDLGTEELEVKKSGTTIDNDQLVYTTDTEPVSFDLSSEWGKYNVIGFMAEKYFAGYDKDDTDDEITDKTISLVSKGMLSKVLIDEDETHSLSTGASLQLEEGYELKIIQLSVGGGQAQLELTNDGKPDLSETIIVEAPDTFVYTKNLGDANDVPIIAVYVDSVFQGTETAMIVIEGIFQISEDYTSVKSGTDYGEMGITSTSATGITMKNSDDIDLDEGGTTMIMGDVGFMASENGARYCLFVRRTIGSLPALVIDVSETPIVDTEITITVTSGGSAVEGAAVTFDGANLGLTDSSGEVTHTPGDAGTFTVTASKENYESASEDVKILTEDEADKDQLAIEMPDVVDPGDDVIIKVTSDGNPVENATVTWDDEEIGETDGTGSLTYTAETVGTYTVTASKRMYLNASEKITVSLPSAEFELTGFTVVPEEVAAKKEFTVTVDVTNVGDLEGTYHAELMIDDGNGTVESVGSTNVTLAPGEAETVEFTHKIASAGVYTVRIDTESEEITVTKSRSNSGVIAAIFIVLAVLGGIGYVLISSAPEGGWTVEKLTDAIKELFRRKGHL